MTTTWEPDTLRKITLLGLNRIYTGPGEHVSDDMRDQALEAQRRLTMISDPAMQRTLALLRAQILDQAANEGTSRVLLDLLLGMITGQYDPDQMAALASRIQSRRPGREAHIVVTASRRHTVHVPYDDFAAAWREDSEAAAGDEPVLTDLDGTALDGELLELVLPFLPLGFTRHADALTIAVVTADLPETITAAGGEIR